VADQVPVTLPSLPLYVPATLLPLMVPERLTVPVLLLQVPQPTQVIEQDILIPETVHGPVILWVVKLISLESFALMVMVKGPLSIFPHAVPEYVPPQLPAVLFPALLDSADLMHMKVNCPKAKGKVDGVAGHITAMNLLGSLLPITARLQP
jgi:hypothetical protein